MHFQATLKITGFNCLKGDRNTGICILILEGEEVCGQGLTGASNVKVLFLR
jgi:hypothetical protein